MDDSDKVSVCIECCGALANSPTVLNNNARSCQPASALRSIAAHAGSERHSLAQGPADYDNPVLQSNEFDVQLRKSVVSQPTMS